MNFLLADYQASLFRCAGLKTVSFPHWLLLGPVGTELTWPTKLETFFFLSQDSQMIICFPIYLIFIQQIFLNIYCTPEIDLFQAIGRSSIQNNQVPCSNLV